MNFRNGVHLGTITKTHGVDGKVILTTHTNMEAKDLREPVFVKIDGLPVPFFIKTIEPKRPNQYITSLELVNSIEEATELVGAEVELPAGDQVLSNSFDLSVLEGMTVLDRNHGEIGTCSRVDEISGNFSIAVASGDDEILIPFTEDFIVEFIPDENYLLLDLPDGLINLNR